MTLGTSQDTSEFACECLAQWWAEHGQVQYPEATKLLILCDGGGSNTSNRHVFKEELQRLADRLGLEIRVAHYTPYCSKHNPIEHRVFPHVTRTCQGVVFDTVELVSDLSSRARTQARLSVTTSILDRVFETGRKVATNFHETCRILRDELLPKWNYEANPIPSSKLREVIADPFLSSSASLPMDAFRAIEWIAQCCTFRWQFAFFRRAETA